MNFLSLHLPKFQQSAGATGKYFPALAGLLGLVLRGGGGGGLEEAGRRTFFTQQYFDYRTGVQPLVQIHTIHF
jgi:hypothetical protein